MLEYEELKRKCTQLFKEGKVRVSSSPCVATFDMVRKSDGSIRVCIDHRAINERTVKNSFPLPSIDDLTDQMRDDTYITHLDLRSAYNQVRMSDDSPSDDLIAATTFQEPTPNGSLCYGIRFVQCYSYFYASYDARTRPIYTSARYCFVYLDDICSYSKSPEEHLDHIR